MENCYLVDYTDIITKQKHCRLIPIDIFDASQGEYQFDKIKNHLLKYHEDVKIVSIKFIPENYSLGFESVWSNKVEKNWTL